MRGGYRRQECARSCSRKWGFGSISCHSELEAFNEQWFTHSHMKQVHSTTTSSLNWRSGLASSRWAKNRSYSRTFLSTNVFILSLAETPLNSSFIQSTRFSTTQQFHDALFPRKIFGVHAKCLLEYGSVACSVGSTCDVYARRYMAKKEKFIATSRIVMRLKSRKK